MMAVSTLLEVERPCGTFERHVSGNANLADNNVAWLSLQVFMDLWSEQTSAVPQSPTLQPSIGTFCYGSRDVCVRWDAVKAGSEYAPPSAPKA